MLDCYSNVTLCHIVQSKKDEKDFIQISLTHSCFAEEYTVCFASMPLKNETFVPHLRHVIYLCHSRMRLLYLN
ncbi:hypothetical protein AMTRI_Chr08g204600 [Amborella trichopoda]